MLKNGLYLMFLTFGMWTIFLDNALLHSCAELRM